nr:hypothetical protein CFP56_00209 [Quercus suber]
MTSTREEVLDRGRHEYIRIYDMCVPTDQELKMPKKCAWPTRTSNAEANAGVLGWVKGSCGPSRSMYDDLGTDRDGPTVGPLLLCRSPRLRVVIGLAFGQDRYVRLVAPPGGRDLICPYVLTLNDPFRLTEPAVLERWRPWPLPAATPSISGSRRGSDSYQQA